MENKNISDYFAELETTKEYDGYFFSITAAVTICILGTFCGLRNMKRIHQWASNNKIRSFLAEHFGIKDLVCYSWFTQVLGLIKPESFNECFIKWVMDSVKYAGLTLSFDGKTICSTGKMKAYKNALHIVNAQIANLGITLGQKAVDSKSNEIPAVRDLIELLDIRGCLVVADALNCQKETAQKIVDGGGDYLLSVKDNQPTLKKEIAEIIHGDEHKKSIEVFNKTEKNRGRIELRTAYIFDNLDLIPASKDWAKSVCVGAINTQFTKDGVTSNEWHYFICSRKLNAEGLLNHARLEWSVEVMHWLLDVHFNEDSCRVVEQNTQENLNIIRKIVLNCFREYKNKNNSKEAFSYLMQECMMEPERILDFLWQN